MTVMEDQGSPAGDATSETDVSRSELDARYGRTTRDAVKVRLLWLATAVGFATAIVVWLVWGGLLGAPAQLEARNAGYEILAPDQIEIQWNLTVPPGTATSCAVQARNEKFAVIGWKVVDVPPSEQRTRTLSEVVRTTEPADSGLIYRCWLN